MKKAKVIGLSISLVVLATVFGIASLPDEVLSESNSVETDQNIPRPVIIQSDVTKENSDELKREVKELNSQNAIKKAELATIMAELEAIKTESKAIEPPTEELESKPVTLSEDQLEETVGRIIRVEINDGVGTQLE